MLEKILKKAVRVQTHDETRLRAGVHDGRDEVDEIMM